MDVLTGAYGTRTATSTAGEISDYGNDRETPVRYRKIVTGRGRWYRRLILGIVAAYFIVPLLASARFSFEGTHNSLSLSGYTSAFKSSQFWSSLSLSVEVGIGTVLIELLLTLGTSLWVNLHAPRWKSFVDTITLLPIVVPVVVLVLGVSGSMHFLPGFIIYTPVILMLEYAVLAMPYAYRIVDSGVRSLGLRTLVDAGRSVGSGWLRIVYDILLPNLKGSLLGAAFMTFALVLGEYVMASLLSFNTFPVWLETVGEVHATEAIALSVVSLGGLTIVLGVFAVVAYIRWGGGDRVADEEGGR